MPSGLAPALFDQPAERPPGTGSRFLDAKEFGMRYLLAVLVALTISGALLGLLAIVWGPAS